MRRRSGTELATGNVIWTLFHVGRVDGAMVERERERRWREGEGLRRGKRAWMVPWYVWWRVHGRPEA